MAKSSQTGKKLEKNLRSNSEVPKHNTIMPPPQTIVNENAQMTGQRTGITESVSEVLGHGTRRRNISSDQISKTDNRDVSHQIREVSCLRSNSEVPKSNTEMPPPLTVVNQNTQMAAQRTGITKSAPDVSERSTIRINISSDQIPETEYGDLHIQIAESLRSPRNISPVSKPNTVMSSPQTILNENTQMAEQRTGITDSISELSGHDTHRRNISSDQIPETEYGDFHIQITERLHSLLNTSPVSKPNTVMSPLLTIVNQNTQMAGQRTGIRERAPDVSERSTRRRNISSDQIPETEYGDFHTQITERLYSLLNTSPVSKPNTVMSPPLTIVNQNTQMVGQRTGITERAPDVSERSTRRRNISSDQIPETDNGDVSRQMREISCPRSNSEDPKPDTVMSPPQTIENQNTQMAGQRTAITESAPDVSRRRTHKRNISSDEISKTDNRDVSRQMREISCLRSNSEDPKPDTVMPPPQTIVNQNTQMAEQRTGITESVPDVSRRRTHKRNISSDEIPKTDNRDVSRQMREISCLRSNSEDPKPDTVMPPPQTIENQNTQMAGQGTAITESAPDVSRRRTHKRNISSDEIPKTDNRDVSRQMREISCLRSNSEDPKPDTVMPPPQTIENQNTQMVGQRTAITESAPDVSRRRTHKRNISSDEIPKTDNRDVSRQMREISCLRSNSEDPKPDTVMPPPQTIENQNTQMAGQRTAITESAPDVSRRRTHKRNISSDEIPKTDNRDVSRQIRETFGTGHPNTMTFQVEHSTPTSIKLRRTIGGTSDLKCSTVEYPTISAPRTSPPVEKPKTKVKRMRHPCHRHHRPSIYGDNPPATIRRGPSSAGGTRDYTVTPPSPMYSVRTSPFALVSKQFHQRMYVNGRMPVTVGIKPSTDGSTTKFISTSPVTTMYPVPKPTPSSNTPKTDHTAKSRQPDNEIPPRSGLESNSQIPAPRRTLAPLPTEQNFSTSDLARCINLQATQTSTMSKKDKAKAKKQKLDNKKN